MKCLFFLVMALAKLMTALGQPCRICSPTGSNQVCDPKDPMTPPETVQINSNICNEIEDNHKDYHNKLCEKYPKPNGYYYECTSPGSGNTFSCRSSCGPPIEDVGKGLNLDLLGENSLFKQNQKQPGLLDFANFNKDNSPGTNFGNFATLGSFNLFNNGQNRGGANRNLFNQGRTSNLFGSSGLGRRAGAGSRNVGNTGRTSATTSSSSSYSGGGGRVSSGRNSANSAGSGNAGFGGIGRSTSAGSGFSNTGLSKGLSNRGLSNNGGLTSFGSSNSGFGTNSGFSGFGLPDTNDVSHNAMNPDFNKNFDLTSGKPVASEKNFDSTFADFTDSFGKNFNTFFERNKPRSTGSSSISSSSNSATGAAGSLGSGAISSIVADTAKAGLSNNTDLNRGIVESLQAGANLGSASSDDIVANIENAAFGYDAERDLDQSVSDKIQELTSKDASLPPGATVPVGEDGAPRAPQSSSESVPPSDDDAPPGLGTPIDPSAYGSTPASSPADYNSPVGSNDIPAGPEIAPVSDSAAYEDEPAYPGNYAAYTGPPDYPSTTQPTPRDPGPVSLSHDLPDPVDPASYADASEAYPPGEKDLPPPPVDGINRANILEAPPGVESSQYTEGSSFPGPIEQTTPSYDHKSIPLEQGDYYPDGSQAQGPEGDDPSPPEGGEFVPSEGVSDDYTTGSLLGSGGEATPPGNEELSDDTEVTQAGELRQGGADQGEGSHGENAPEGLFPRNGGLSNNLFGQTQGQRNPFPPNQGLFPPQNQPQQPFNPNSNNSPPPLGAPAPLTNNPSQNPAPSGLPAGAGAPSAVPSALPQNPKSGGQPGQAAPVPGQVSLSPVPKDSQASPAQTGVAVSLPGTDPASSANSPYSTNNAAAVPGDVGDKTPVIVSGAGEPTVVDTTRTLVSAPNPAAPKNVPQYPYNQQTPGGAAPKNYPNPADTQGSQASPAQIDYLGQSGPNNTASAPQAAGPSDPSGPPPYGDPSGQQPLVTVIDDGSKTSKDAANQGPPPGIFDIPGKPGAQSTGSRSSSSTPNNNNNFRLPSEAFQNPFRSPSSPLGRRGDQFGESNPAYVGTPLFTQGFIDSPTLGVGGTGLNIPRGPDAVDESADQVFPGFQQFEKTGTGLGGGQGGVFSIFNQPSTNSRRQGGGAGGGGLGQIGLAGAGSRGSSFFSNPATQNPGSVFNRDFLQNGGFPSSITGASTAQGGPTARSVTGFPPTSNAANNGGLGFQPYSTATAPNANNNNNNNNVFGFQPYSRSSNNSPSQGFGFQPQTTGSDAGYGFPIPIGDSNPSSLGFPATKARETVDGLPRSRAPSVSVSPAFAAASPSRSATAGSGFGDDSQFGTFGSFGGFNDAAFGGFGKNEISDDLFKNGEAQETETTQSSSNSSGQ